MVFDVAFDGLADADAPEPWPWWVAAYDARSRAADEEGSGRRGGQDGAEGWDVGSWRWCSSV